jgi:tungstate transport system ATP-binding protein
MRLCHGLLTPTSGRIVWQGSHDERRPRAQAMVFQRPVMLRRSALDNVTYGLALAGVVRARRESRAREVLDLVGLGAAAARHARVLSGGEQQRLALARALARDPEALFLDEPTASLDPASTKAVEDILRATAASGVKIVMATHDLGQARRLAGDIVFLVRGRVVEHASAARFFSTPATTEAAAFLRGDLVI